MHRVDSLICTPQKWQSSLALDHSRLGLENKSGRIFLRSTSLLYKILPTNLGACKLTFYTIQTSHLRWNSTMRHCFYHTGRPRTKSSISQYKLHSFNIHKLLKKISQITYTAIRFSLLYCELWWVFEWTLTELRSNIIKNLLFNGLLTRGILSTPEAMFTERLKTFGTAIKITGETTNNQ